MTEKENELHRQEIILLEKELNYLLNLKIEVGMRENNLSKIQKKLKSLIYQKKRYAKHSGKIKELETWMTEKGEYYLKLIQNYQKI